MEPRSNSEYPIAELIQDLNHKLSVVFSSFSTSPADVFDYKCFANEYKSNFDLPGPEEYVLCHLVFVISPAHFYIRFAELETYSDVMENTLTEIYQKAIEDQLVQSITKNQLNAGLACVTWNPDEEVFMRAQIDIIGVEDVHVDYIDHGTGRFAPYDQVYPLIQPFDHPRLAMLAATVDVDKRELTAKRVDAFNAKMSELNFEVLTVFAPPRVRKNEYDPYQGYCRVYIYDPKTDENLGAKYTHANTYVRPKPFKRRPRYSCSESDEPLTESDEEPTLHSRKYEYDYGDAPYYGPEPIIPFGQASRAWFGRLRDYAWTTFRFTFGTFLFFPIRFLWQRVLSFVKAIKSGPVKDVDDHNLP